MIAAHANSSNGVAMRGFPIGGQTKIAYTQDPHLHALEVTDLENKGNRSTAAFFNGTKPEYPRRMHCIQGSDSHRLTADPFRKKNLGVGDRTTDVLLPEVSFEALRELFVSNDFARTRPHRMSAEPVFDFIRSAQEEGVEHHPGFPREHDRARRKALRHHRRCLRPGQHQRRHALHRDHRRLQRSRSSASQDVELIALTSSRKRSATGSARPLQCSLDIHETGGKKIIVASVPRGIDPPYAVDDNKIYVRSEAETVLAVRDEIVGLVLRSHGSQVGERLENQAGPVR